MRTWILILIKIAVVAALLAWLISSGKLDFRELQIFWDRPAVLAANIGIWIACSLLLGTLRWHLLLRGLDIHIQYGRALRFQLIGFFFNTAMPGAVGGDIIKAVYVIREQHGHRRTPAMLTVLLDRVVGLAALFVIAGGAVAFNFAFFAAHPTLVPVGGFVLAGLLALSLGLAVVLLPYQAGKDPIDWLLGRQWPGFALLHQIYTALRCYRKRPWILVSTLVLSCFIQGLNICYAWWLTAGITGASPDAAVFATIFPVGIMTTALPLAPGGLGVGHLAFEKLYALAGLHGGANVFNVMVLGQLSLNLIGVIPYLFYRRQGPAVRDLDLEITSPDLGNAAVLESPRT